MQEALLPIMSWSCTKETKTNSVKFKSLRLFRERERLVSRGWFTLIKIWLDDWNLLERIQAESYHPPACCSQLIAAALDLFSSSLHLLKNRDQERPFQDLVSCTESKDGLFPRHWSVKFFDVECRRHCFHSTACFPAAFLSYNSLGMDQIELLRLDNKFSFSS